MIVITDQMKKPMDDDPVEFVRKFCPVLDGIFSDTVDTYKEVTGQFIAFAIIKGDDIGKIIMLQVLLIDIKYIIVGTENNRNLSYTTDFAFSYKTEPSVIQSLPLEYKISIFKII